jgi:hypothetical protein
LQIAKFARFVASDQFNGILRQIRDLGFKFFDPAVQSLQTDGLVGQRVVEPDDFTDCRGDPPDDFFDFDLVAAKFRNRFFDRLDYRLLDIFLSGRGDIFVLKKKPAEIIDADPVNRHDNIND